MRRAPITDRPVDASVHGSVDGTVAPASTGFAPAGLAVAEELDEGLGVHALFFSVPRREVAYFKIVVEAGDGYGVSRTMQRHHDGDPSRALVVVLAVPGFLEPCAHMLARLCEETGSVQVPSTPELREDLAKALPAEG